MKSRHLLGLLSAVLILAAPTAIAVEPSTNPINAARAMGYLEAICAIGPRVSGSRGMIEQQKLITDHFKKLGMEVEVQRFQAAHPQNRSRRVKMANLVVRWRPEAIQRVLFCAHYDTRPFPDQDRDPQARRSGVFIGANDGGSGTALLMELGNLMAEKFDEAAPDQSFGVDFVFFDGEELVFNDRDPYFLGSQWFATQYAKRKPLPAVDGGEERVWNYDAAVLFDMVADKNLQVHWEGHSIASRQSRPIAREVWDVAERLGVKEFVPQVRHTVQDDHLALRQYGGIRAIDVIDFDYPYWHTTGDTPDKCSGESLAKVGWVAWEWLLQKANDQ
jgi:glutaminyl-peptide cyclotransferase